MIEGAHTINMSNYGGKAHPLTTTNWIVPGSIGIGIEDFSVKKDNLSSVTCVLSGAYKTVWNYLNKNNVSACFFTFRYINDVLSLYNIKLGDFLARIYALEHKIKDTTDTAKSASYIALHLEVDSKAC